MSLAALNLRHVSLIARYWTRYAIRGGGAIVFAVIATLFGLGVTQGVLMSIQLAQQQAAAQGRELTDEEFSTTFAETGAAIFRWAMDIELPEGESQERASALGGIAQPMDAWSKYLFADRPALLSGIFLILLFGMPLVVPFIAFNQVSGDVQSRGLRYLLLRTERANIYFGRFLGTAVCSVCVMGGVITLITLYLSIKMAIYPVGDMWLWALHGFLALAVLMIPFVALCSWLSASIDSPFFSLVATSLVIGGVPLFAFLAGLKWEWAANLKYALPGSLQFHLLHPEPLHAIGTGLACLGYAAVYLGIGYWHFDRRDL